MGFEDRNGRLYYYHKRREGDQVISEYVGSGAIAELQAEVEQLDRVRRAVEQRRLAKEIAAIMEIEDQLDQEEAAIYSLVKAAYLENGFYRHHRTWRKRNVKRDSKEL